MGTKVSAVSRKTNTTTHEVLGVMTKGDTQIVCSPITCFLFASSNLWLSGYRHVLYQYALMFHLSMVFLNKKNEVLANVSLL